MNNSRYIYEERPSDRHFSGTAALCLAEAAGIVLGAFAAVRLSLPDKLTAILCPAASGGAAAEVFTGTLTVLLIIIAAAFLLGLFAFGQLPALLLTVSAGASIGIAGSAFYAAGGLSALPAVLVLHLPRSAAITAVTLLAVRESCRSSAAILGTLTGRERENCGLKLYCIKFIVLTIISLMISAADALLNYLFAK